MKWNGNEIGGSVGKIHFEMNVPMNIVGTFKDKPVITTDGVVVGIVEEVREFSPEPLKRMMQMTLNLTLEGYTRLRMMKPDEGFGIQVTEGVPAVVGITLGAKKPAGIIS